MSDNPTDWRILVASDGTNVYRTTDAGATAFKDITGNLAALGVTRVISVAAVAAVGPESIVIGTNIGVFVTSASRLGCPKTGTTCNTAWQLLGTSFPRTIAESVVYNDNHGVDTLLVGTLGRGAYKLTNASSVLSGDNQLFGAAPADQAFELDVQLQPSPLASGATADYTVNATTGNFTLTYTDISGSQTTTPIAVGSPAATVQAALAGLSNVGAATGKSVDLNGSKYTITFQATGDASHLTFQEVIPGTVRRTSSPMEFAAALQTKMTGVLTAAGETGSTATAVLDTGMLKVGQTGAFKLQVKFPEPIQTQAGTKSVSLSAPGVNYTPAPGKSPINRDRRLTITVGLQGPGRVAATADTSAGTLAAGTYRYVVTAVMSDSADSNTSTRVLADVPVVIPGADEYQTIDDLVAALQGAIDTALDNSALGTHNPDNAMDNGNPVSDVLACRPSDGPSATGLAACQGTGNRILFHGKPSVVNTLSIDVPENLDQGDNEGTPNGAVTMLCYNATSGETHRARASRFSLANFRLTGTFDLFVQNLAVTANVGFLAVKATAQGTLPANRLLSLTIAVFLRNPNAQKGAMDEFHLDLAVLANTIGDGHFFYDKNADFVHGSNDHPATGFFAGALSGGLCVKPTLAPAGGLAGRPHQPRATVQRTAPSPNCVTIY